MRTRETYFNDYGITKDEEERLKALCREPNPRTRSLLHTAAYTVNPQLACDIIYSLVNTLSYDKICLIRDIPIKRDDFYGYRRKTLAELKRIINTEKCGDNFSEKICNYSSVAI